MLLSQQGIPKGMLYMDVVRKLQILSVNMNILIHLVTYQDTSIKRREKDSCEMCKPNKRHPIDNTDRWQLIGILHRTLEIFTNM